jgi:methionyl-tRNA formyltransferase
VILDAGYTIAAVITAPDKPTGRGQVLRSSPVKEYALAKSLKVLQPLNLKNPEFITELKSYDSNLFVVVAFRMLPEVIWQMPVFGSVNLHASLLPQYRGAAPINHVIINGETETGLTTFFIEKEIDKGKIILMEKLPIEPSDDAGILHDRLMHTGGKLLLQTIKMIEIGDIPLQSQEKINLNSLELKTAPKIFKEDCKIRWDSSCISIHNLVRGLSPFPGAHTKLVLKDENESKQIKIFKTTIKLENITGSPGTIITDWKKSLSVIAEGGLVNILELQVEGKKRMGIIEFMRGLHLNSEFHFE